MLTETQSDSLCWPQVTLRQAERGVKANLDSVLLARFVHLRATDSRLLELGCGQGAILLLLAARFPQLGELTGLDIRREDLARLQQSLSQNTWLGTQMVHTVWADWRTWRPALEDAGFPVVVCNPPWFVRGSGRRSPHADRAVAREELNGTFAETLAAAVRLLAPKGRFFLAHRALRLEEIVATFAASPLRIKRLQFVHDRPGRAAKTVLIEAHLGGNSGLEVLPPLFVRTPEGRYASPVADWLEPADGLGV